ncbi:Mce protein [Mycobacterium sp. 1164966.3]|uniref:Mce protein n=1 Tax=Mycobacterium sp. 1164966.3 TaxID=1856861 RepID=UPI000A560121|nr:Mce protein [Mycobacterium sp. 1164966.3]
MATEIDNPDSGEQTTKVEIDDSEHDEAADAVESDEVDADDEADDGEADEKEPQSVEPRAPRRLSNAGWALVASALVVAMLAGLAGWFGYRGYQKHEAQALRELFVQTARQGALNLTTINYTEAEADVQRVLDSATGAFRDDFAKRSQPFIEVVKAARSQSEGTITEAGLESQRGDSAEVLVAVAVKSRTAVGEQAPREWRMRIQVQAVGDGAKVSNVVFVP